jgi:plastocyanin
MRGVGTIGCVLLMASVAAGCGSGSGSGSTGTPGTSSSPSAPLAGATSGSGGGSTGSSTGGGINNIQQGRGGLVFTPSTLSVKQGTKIFVSNVGYFQHSFTISGTGIDVVNDPLEYQDVAITLGPGTYTFVCTFHQSQGMKGTLTVTS